MTFIRNIWFGISTGCTVFVAASLIGYWSIGQLFLEAVLDNFVQHITGSIIVGLACILPSHIYKIDRLTLLQQSAFHFFIAIGTFFVVAFSLKWIPTLSMKITLLSLLFSILLFVIIWFIFYFHSQAEVKKMKDKIKNHSHLIP